MSWAELELDDWFDAYLPGEEVPSNNLRWIPFEVDLASEHTMLTGLKYGIQDMIRTAGCHSLEVRETCRHLDSTDSDSDAGQETWPSSGLGIYSVSRSYPDVKNSFSSSDNSCETSHVCYDSLEVPLGVRHETIEYPAASSPGTPPTGTPPFSSTCIYPSSDSLPQAMSTSKSDCSPSSSEASPWEHYSEMMEYVIEIFNRQHRLCVFAIYFENENAYLLHFDRTGVSMTPTFEYAQHPEIIGKFLYRVSRSRDTMGHDPTATPTNEADTAMFRTLHAQYRPESTVARCLKVAAADDWPMYRLTIEGGFSPDEQSAVRRDAPISRREFLIGKPMSFRRSLFGRGTKVHVAYDVEGQKAVVIKDSWRPSSGDARSEYDTYLLLTDSEGQEVPTEIPTLLGGGDVVYQGVTQETRTSNTGLVPRVHVRLVFKEVCRPLEDFVDSLELITAVSYAFGAHFVALTAASVLHRDVSVGNILILDGDPEGPPDPSTSKGLLADWDLARTKDELDNPMYPQTTRAGTWPFMSARLQHTGPEQQHELSDDLESFYHVLNYCALKYLPNNLSLSSDNTRVTEFISDVYNSVRESDGLYKGSYDKLDMLVNNRPFVQLRMDDHPLTTVLKMLSDLCWRHYHHIQFRPRQASLPPGPAIIPGREPKIFRSSALQHFSHVVVDPPATAKKTLPLADPEQSPFKDHAAMGGVFYWATQPRRKWPSDKIEPSKALIVP